jgi:phosphoserine aminotransferase
MSKEHIPTESLRRQVSSLAAHGIAHDKIARVTGMSINTLRKHYLEDIKNAKAQAEALVAQNLFNKATKGQGSDSLKAAALWYAKAEQQGELEKVKRKVGRSPIYTPELAEKVLEHVANGGFVSQLQAKGLPSNTTISKWINENEEFASLFARAREQRAEVFADQIIEIADGKGDPQSIRNRVDARKFIAMKLLPRVYGERQQLEVTTEIGKTAANVLMALTERAKAAKQLEHNVIDVTPQRFADTLPPK